MAVKRLRNRSQSLPGNGLTYAITKGEVASPRPCSRWQVPLVISARPAANMDLG